MVQIIKYKCCGNIFAACCEPECYTDKDWLSSLKKYVNRGDRVDMSVSKDIDLPKFEKMARTFYEAMWRHCILRGGLPCR